MERRSQLSSSPKLVLDTSYVLPFLGIQVDELLSEELAQVLEGFKLYYPTAMLAELLGVFFKQLKKAEASHLLAEVKEGLDSLAYSGEVELLPLTSEVAEEAYKLIKAGCRDIFDAIAYATARSTGALLLTLDTELKRFLEERGMPRTSLVDHRKLVEFR